MYKKNDAVSVFLVLLQKKPLKAEVFLFVFSFLRIGGSECCKMPLIWGNFIEDMTAGTKSLGHYLKITGEILQFI